MTLSILARDPATGALGAAAATGNLAVGAWVLRAAAGVGAVATQGLSPSTLWGDEALQRLRDGAGARETVDALTGGDAGRAHRQLAVLDHTGATAAWTGDANLDAKGDRTGADYVIAGNWLVSSQVLAEMERAFTSTAEDPQTTFAERLMAVLEAGIAAGSDQRGTHSAALRVVSPTAPPLDLRVDYDDAPLTRLRALYARATSPTYLDWVKHLPTLTDPSRC